MVDYARKEKNRDNVSRLVYERYYPLILSAFETAHGGIVEEYIEYDCYIGAVLTDKNELHLAQGPVVKKGVYDNEFFEQCEKIQIEAHRLLEGTNDLHIVMKRLYSLVTYLYGFYVRTKSMKPTSKERNQDYLKVIDFIHKEIADVNNYLMRSAQRHAQIEYFNGIFIGALLVVGATGIMTLVLYYLFKVPIIALATVFWSLIAGGVGAMISVMSRMSLKGIKIDQEAGPSQIWRQGIYRPIIGSIMGVIINALMLSGLLPIELPGNASAQQYFYIVIAFISGFSERWAPNILEVVSGRIMEGAKKESEEPTSEANQTKEEGN